MKTTRARVIYTDRASNECANERERELEIINESPPLQASMCDMSHACENMYWGEENSGAS